MPADILKVLLPTILTFLIGIILTPRLTDIFFKHKLWKRISRDDKATNPTITDTFAKIHNAEKELSTPRVGGIVIWLSVIVTVGVMWLLSRFVPSEVTIKLDFFSKSQTAIPIVALLVGAGIGLFEDMLEIFGEKWLKLTHGLPKGAIIGIVSVVGLLMSLWFHIKLEMSSVYVPFVGDIEIGIWFIPFFLIVTLGTFSSRVIDGVDGLAGGVMASIFASYAVIAFMQTQIDIATLSAVIVGGILVFLWFNIPPARFWMGETGMLALTLALVAIAFLTNAVLVFLVIGLPLVVTSLSSALQLASKRLRNGKKLFLISPLHNYFLAIGWSREKVTMRYWVISVMCSVIGIIIVLIG